MDKLENTRSLDDPGLSATRGIASLVVLIAHAIQVYVLRVIGPDHLVGGIAGQMAKQAVMVFFIVSGYLITQSILKNFIRNGYKFDPLQFLAARFARIYPPLIFATTLCLIFYFVLSLLGLPGGEALHAEPLGLATDLYIVRPWFAIQRHEIGDVLLMRNGMLQVNGPLWSLCIEWRIYLLAGAFAMLCSSKWLSTRIFWGVILIALARMLRDVNEDAFFFALIWALGGLTALLEVSRFKALLPKSKLLPGILVLCVAAVSWLWPKLLLPDETFDSSIDKLFQMLVCVTWITLLFRSGSWSWKFKSKFMWVGDFSYTLYIVHFPILLFVLALTQGFLGNSVAFSIFIAGCAASIALAFSVAIGRLVERKEEAQPSIVKSLAYFISFLEKILSELSLTEIKGDSSKSPIFMPITFLSFREGISIHRRLVRLQKNIGSKSK